MQRDKKNLSNMRNKMKPENSDDNDNTSLDQANSAESINSIITPKATEESSILSVVPENTDSTLGVIENPFDFKGPPLYTDAKISMLRIRRRVTSKSSGASSSKIKVEKFKRKCVGTFCNSRFESHTECTICFTCNEMICYLCPEVLKEHSGHELSSSDRLSYHLRVYDEPDPY